jgi:hypothetical protein
MWEPTSGVDFCEINRKIVRKKFQLGDYVLWFPKGEKTHMGKLKKRWFGPFRVLYQTQYWLMLIS